MCARGWWAKVRTTITFCDKKDRKVFLESSQSKENALQMLIGNDLENELLDEISADAEEKRKVAQARDGNVRIRRRFEKILSDFSALREKFLGTVYLRLWDTGRSWVDFLL